MTTIAMRIVRVLALILLAQCATQARAEPLRLGADVAYSLLIDKMGKLSPDDVLAQPADRFQKMTSIVAKGFTHDVVWLRIDLPQSLKDGRERYLEIEPSFLDYVHLYEPNNSGWRLHEAGDMVAFAKRDIKHRNFVFRITPQGDRPLLIRIKTTSTMAAIGRLWEPADFNEAVQEDIVRWGFYFGGITFLILFMVGASIIFYNRKLAVLSASSLLVTLHTVNLQGFPAQFIENVSPRLLSDLVGIGSVLGVAANIYIIRTLLTEGRNVPKLDRLLVGLTLFSLLCTVSVPLGFYGQVATPSRIVLVLCAAIGLMLAVRQLKERRLYQYVLAGSLVYFIVTLILNILVYAGVVSNPFALVAVWYALLPYSALIFISISLEIFQEYNTWKLEQKKTLIRTQLEEKSLEAKVASRTADLLEVQEQLKRTLHRKREIMLEQRQFVSMVSHEFRTPLAILDSAAINLTAVPPSDINELAERTAQMRRAIQRLNHLVNNCLTGDRIEQGAFTLQACDVSIADMVKKTMLLVSLTPENQFDVNISAAPLIWRCDPTLIRIALSNLFNNALKHTEGRKIAISAKQEGTFLVWEVTNIGVGIAHENMVRIFEKYVQLGDSRQGVGLGLYVSRQIAQLHNGDISVMSIPNEATTFCMKVGWVDGK